MTSGNIRVSGDKVQAQLLLQEERPHQTSDNTCLVLSLSLWERPEHLTATSPWDTE